MADFKKEVEAILFAAGRVVTLKELQKLLHLKDPGMIKETIRELKEEYDSNESPLVIIAEGEGEEVTGWKLTVREKMLPLVHKINPHTELSKSILETLAVITWKQPIVQSDVIKIRTNKAYDHIAELLRMGFISKKKFGRSYKISVTQKFLDYFDLKDNKEIKEMFKDFKDVEVAVQKKKEDLEKAAPEGSTSACSDEEEKKQESADKEESSNKEDCPDKEGVSDEKIESEGVELEPYIDVLPESTKPHKMDGVEVYERSEEDIARDMMREDQKAKKDFEISEDVDGAEDSEQEGSEETDEEKARRLAKELVEDEKEAEEEEAERERELHPELEDFIASSEDEDSPKGEEDHSDEISEEKEEDDDSDAGEGHDHEEPAHEEGGGSVGEDGDPDKPKPAEEFPGQFDGQDGSDSEAASKEEADKEDA